MRLTVLARTCAHVIQIVLVIPTAHVMMSALVNSIVPVKLIVPVFVDVILIVIRLVRVRV